MKKIISFILSIMISILVFPFGVFAETQIIDTENVDFNSDAISAIPEITENFLDETTDENIVMSNYVDSDSYECLSLNSIPDGIYAFKNLGNENRWMHIERNKTVPGYHVQQYSNNNVSPSIECADSCLFKVTQYKDTGYYIIRLKLNEELSFGFDDDGYVITKEIPKNDNDVSVYDTFVITYHVTGYTIKPYGKNTAICANQTNASGEFGAPDSYLIEELPSHAEDCGKWIIEGYESQPKDGIYAFSNMGNGLRWMDIERNKTVPGYHVQQYANNNKSPAEEYLASGLFKVTRVERSGSYTIRSMLNLNLSFGFSDDGSIITKTIAANDEEVSLSDTFYICFTNGGYIIRSFGSNYIVGANVTTASGASGAPDSYLIKTNFYDVDKYSTWRMQGYQTVFDSGVYYITNSYGVSEGSYDRMIATLDGSYTENTSIRQQRCDIPEIDSDTSRIWVVKRIYENYYTIASSQKPNMYISWNSQTPDLMEVSAFDVESTDEILWKFEGNEAVGYTITSKANSSASITAPLGTAGGLLLQFSDKTTTTDGRNVWKMNGIKNAYIISICAVTHSNSSSINWDFGHCWISFENLSTTDLKLIHIDVPKNDYITIGKWGNQNGDNDGDIDRNRMWYNLEREFYALFSNENGVQISIVIGYDKIDELNEVLNQNYDDIWSANDNCTHLACEIWNSIFNTTYNEGLPIGLKNFLESEEKCITGVKLTDAIKVGFYDGNELITNVSPIVPG